MIEVSNRKVKCPSFLASEETIQELGREMRRMDLPASERLAKARSFLSEVEFLASSHIHGQNDPNGLICQTICKLRRIAAVHVMKTCVKNLRYNF